MEKYMHVITGAVSTKEVWVWSYLAEELNERGITAEEAFSEDLYDTLYPVQLGCSGEWIFKKY